MDSKLALRSTKRRVRQLVPTNLRLGEREDYQALVVPGRFSDARHRHRAVSSGGARRGLELH